MFVSLSCNYMASLCKADIKTMPQELIGNYVRTDYNLKKIFLL